LSPEGFVLSLSAPNGEDYVTENVALRYNILFESGRENRIAVFVRHKTFYVVFARQILHFLQKGCFVEVEKAGREHIAGHGIVADNPHLPVFRRVAAFRAENVSVAFSVYVQVGVVGCRSRVATVGQAQAKQALLFLFCVVDLYLPVGMRFVVEGADRTAARIDDGIADTGDGASVPLLCRRQKL